MRIPKIAPNTWNRVGEIEKVKTRDIKEWARLSREFMKFKETPIGQAEMEALEKLRKEVINYRIALKEKDEVVWRILDNKLHTISWTAFSLQTGTLYIDSPI